MQFKEIKAMWAEDEFRNPKTGQKDENYIKELPGLAALESVKLQSKYMNFLSPERYALFQLEEKRRTLRHDLSLYYLKKDNEEIRERLGRKPRSEAAVLKADVKTWVDVDPLMVSMNLAVAAQDEKVEYIRAIIQNLQNRNWGIKSHIDWEKFMAGVGGG